MLNIRQCLDCGTKLSQEPWAPELCPRCSLQLALEQSPVEIDVGDDPEALPTRQFPNQTFSPGQILGSRFQIRSLLGRGGMGEVWRAYDLKLRVDVALKALRAELLEKERALQALRQEVRTAREVISPNVCRVFDLVELDGQELVSMEYIDGTTLVAVLHSRGPLELQEAREIASQFLAGLEAIHKADLLHRDLEAVLRGPRFGGAFVAFVREFLKPGLVGFLEDRRLARVGLGRDAIKDDDGCRDRHPADGGD